MAQEILKSITTLKEFDDEKGIIRGYANVYNVKDSDGDISLFGSFTKTVTERGKKIRIFKNHDMSLVGVPVEFDLTDTYGLGLTAKMLMDTPSGRDAYNEVKFLFENGFESGMSIGGWVEKRSTKNPAEVVEYKLREISVLTTVDPANELSLVNMVKSVKELAEPTQEEFWKVIEKAYNDKFSDSMLKSLEEFLTLKDKEPSSDTLVVEPSASDIIKSVYSKYTKN